MCNAITTVPSEIQIDFTVVCLVTWHMNEREARVDLVLIETSLIPTNILAREQEKQVTVAPNESVPHIICSPEESCWLAKIQVFR